MITSQHCDITNKRLNIGHMIHISQNKLPGTIIEVTSPKTFSGTGRASAYRCRDLISSRRFLFRISLGWIIFFSSATLFAPFNFSLTSKSVETDTSATFLTAGVNSFTFKPTRILVGRLSHRLPSKSRPATHGSSLWDSDPPTKCSAWMRLDRSSALTPEPMKNSTTEISTHPSSLTALVRPDLVPRKIISVLPPSSAKLGGRKLLNLMLLYLPCCGPSPRYFYSPFSPLSPISKPRKSLVDLSPHLLWPMFDYYFSLARRLPRAVAMDLGWTCLSLSRIMVDRLGRLCYDARLISNCFGLTPLSKCLRVSLPVSFNENFLSSTLPLVPLNSGLAGRGLHASRVLVSLGWFDSYLCRDQITDLYRTLSETPNPNHYLLPKRVKKNGIMIPSPQSGGYRSFFISISPLPLKTELIHVQIKKLRYNTQTFKRLKKNGIMTSSPRRGGYRSFSNPLYPAASSVEHSFKSSYALCARAVYDHPLVEDFAKPVFMVESAMASKDFSNIANLLKLSISLENSWSLYLYCYCIFLASVCVNFPLMRS